MSNEMFWLLLLFTLETFPVIDGDRAYVKTQTYVPVASIIKTMHKISSLQCLMKCRKSKDCKQAAMQHITDSSPVCLHLDKEFSGECSTGNGCEGVYATMLEEVKTNLKAPKGSVKSSMLMLALLNPRDADRFVYHCRSVGSKKYRCNES